MQERVYVHKITSIDELKLFVFDELDKMDQQPIDNAIKHRRKRLTGYSLRFCMNEKSSDAI